MATVIPFKGIRPQTKIAHLVPSRSVTTYSSNEIKNEITTNPYSFLQIILPDYNDEKKSKPDTPKRLNKIKKKFKQFIKDEILIQDKQPCYYIYQQKKNKNTFTGIIGCCSINDYLNGVIEKHEETITSREEKLKNYLAVCNFNAEPVLFSYPDNEDLNNLVKTFVRSQPQYSFKTEDHIKHKLWVVKKSSIINTIERLFKQTPHLYIADGHHRSASSVLYGKMQRKEKPNYKGNEAFNFYLGIFFPETQLKIYNYNRVVKGLNNLSEKEFIKKITEKFIVIAKGDKVYKPTKKHNFGMYFKNKWYSITIKEEFIKKDTYASNLDSEILLEHLLAPILNIRNLKTDKHVDFIPGTKGIKELKKQIDTGAFDIGFALYPIKIKELKQIADANEIMPPKTTWIEPKLRSGMVVYDLKD